MFRVNWGNGQVSEVFWRFEHALRELTARIGRPSGPGAIHTGARR